MSNLAPGQAQFTAQGAQTIAKIRLGRIVSTATSFRLRTCFRAQL